MPEFRKVCDVYQGFNYKKDRQTPVGYITSMKLNGAAVAVDTTVKDPLKPSDDLKVVAVLSDVLWELGVTDSLYFTGQISVFNKQTLMALVYNTLTNVEVVFKYIIYEYDPVAKVYFKSFHCNDTDMNGVLEKKGEDLNLSISDDPAREVQSPENYTVNVGIKPQPSAQALTVSSSSTKNVVKAWGLTVSG